MLIIHTHTHTLNESVVLFYCFQVIFVRIIYCLRVVQVLGIINLILHALRLMKVVIDARIFWWVLGNSFDALNTKSLYSPRILCHIVVRRLHHSFIVLLFFSMSKREFRRIFLQLCKQVAEICHWNSVSFSTFYFFINIFNQLYTNYSSAHRILLHSLISFLLRYIYAAVCVCFWLRTNRTV